jgi:Cd2+/Zn2+-exporting ATPase
VINQNFMFGILFIIVGMIGASYGVINPIVAAVLHNAGSLIVVFNSARLVRQGEELGSFEPEQTPAGTDGTAAMAPQPA